MWKLGTVTWPNAESSRTTAVFCTTSQMMFGMPSSPSLVSRPPIVCFHIVGALVCGARQKELSPCCSIWCVWQRKIESKCHPSSVTLSWTNWRRHGSHSKLPINRPTLTTRSTWRSYQQSQQIYLPSIICRHSQSNSLRSAEPYLNICFSVFSPDVFFCSSRFFVFPAQFRTQCRWSPDGCGKDTASLAWPGKQGRSHGGHSRPQSRHAAPRVSFSDGAKRRWGHCMPTSCFLQAAAAGNQGQRLPIRRLDLF